MTNIEVAIKHFEKRNSEFKGKLSADEVLRTLYFLKQCEDQKLKLIGIRYTIYDGELPFKKIKLKQMYQGGFVVAESRP